MDTYLRALVDLQEHLARHRVAGWADRLGEWIAEGKSLPEGRARQHVLRTKQSLSGMGSLGDIVISAEAGDAGVETRESRKSANEELQRLLDRLYDEVSLLLRAGEQSAQ